MNSSLRLAYLTPLPPARTGIADYSLELLPALSRRADVMVFAEQGGALLELAGIPVLPLSDYPAARWQFDAAVYQMGNSAYHAAISQLLRRYPGIMVLHDFGLHQLWASQSLAVGRPVIYQREMGYALGANGLAQASAVAAGRQEPPHFEVALNDRFLRASLGVITHSHYAQRLVSERVPDQLTAVVSAPIGAAGAPSLRDRLELPAHACVFGSFGVVSHTKQLEAALVALAEARRENPDLYYLIVGEWQSRDVDVPALAARLGLGDAVRSTGFVPSLAEFLGWMSAVDVVINLRYPTVGETSAVALRALAAGRALVVYDHGWYSELPSDACLKLPPLDAAALAACLRMLALDPSVRAAIGQRGREYALAAHSPETAAAGYVDFVQRVLAHAGARVA
jgi:glycosyltransferase involved in cell wall biosynthesis